MSQGDLAKRMAERGWPWHPNTVYRVEHGKQAVRLDEAAALAKVLETSIDRLTWPTAEASATEWVYAAGYTVRRLHEEIAQLVHRMLAAMTAAERALAETERNASERVQEARSDTAARLEEYSLDEAVSEGVRRWEDRAAGLDEEEPDGSRS